MPEGKEEAQAISVGVLEIAAMIMMIVQFTAYTSLAKYG
jgi:hypothetical protein